MAEHHMAERRHPSYPAHLLHARVVAAGAILLIGAFVTDLAYWQTLSSQWETFSIWLLTAGLIVAALAGLALLRDVAVHGRGWIDPWRFAGLAAAALLSLLNAFIHNRDAYTAVMPQGLTLSCLVSLLLLAVGWRRWSLRAPQPVTQPQPGRAQS